MKIEWVILTVIVGVAGCDSPALDSPIMKAVRAELKDPDSAKFKDELVVRTRACISVNAKNSYGGYTGATIAHLRNLGVDNWVVETINGEPCYSHVLEEKLAIDKANQEAEKSFIEKLKAKKLIGANVQDLYSIENEKCREFALDIMASTRLAIEAKNEEQKRGWQYQVNRKMATIDAGPCSQK